MNIVNASTGWLWVKHAFALFKQRPFEFVFLFFALMLCNLLMSAIPFLGQILPFILSPLMGMGFMHACREVDEGRSFSPSILFVAFRSTTRAALLTIGALYTLALLLALGLSSFFDGGLLWSILSGAQQLDPKTVNQSLLAQSFVITWLAYLPMAMLFWFAAPLIMWHGMTANKAMFYSFFAVWRSIAAFVVYGIAWAALLLLIPSAIAAFISAIVGNANLVQMIAVPIMLSLIVVMYCSFYSSYKSIFEQKTSE
jgi:hypothetical protein